MDVLDAVGDALAQHQSRLRGFVQDKVIPY